MSPLKKHSFENVESPKYVGGGSSPNLIDNLPIKKYGTKDKFS